MTTRSSVLARYQSAAADTFVTLYTAPAGEVVLLKTAQIVVFGSGPLQFRMFLRHDPGDLEVDLVDTSLQPLTPLYLTTWQVLEAGDKVVARFFGALTCVWLSGAVLPVTD